MNEQEELSDAIINFQVKHHVTGDGQFTAEEVNQLYDYMSANA